MARYFVLVLHRVFRTTHKAEGLYQLVNAKEMRNQSRVTLSRSRPDAEERHEGSARRESEGGFCYISNQSSGCMFEIGGRCLGQKKDGLVGVEMSQGWTLSIQYGLMIDLI